MIFHCSSARLPAGRPIFYLLLMLAVALGAPAIDPATPCPGGDHALGRPGAGAIATSSEPDTRPDLLTDGRPTATREDIEEGSWTGPARSGIWVEFRWSEPESITSVQIYGSAGGGAQVKSGLLTFSDGDSFEVGEILGDPAFPTTIAFPAKTVSSVAIHRHEASRARARWAWPRCGCTRPVRRRCVMDHRRHLPSPGIGTILPARPGRPRRRSPGRFRFCAP